MTHHVVDQHLLFAVATVSSIQKKLQNMTTPLWWNDGGQALRLEIDGLREFLRLGEWRYSETKIIYGLPWRITANPHDYVDPMTGNRSRWLGVYVQCNADSKSPCWTCDAAASITLKGRAPNCPDRGNDVDHLFNHKINDYGYTEFVSQAELLDPAKGFCIDDTIVLEAMIQVKKVQDSQEGEIKFCHRIDGFKNFMVGRESRLSAPTFVRGLPWKIVAYPKDNPKNKHRCMAFFVQCNPDSVSTSWSCNAHIRFRLVGWKEGSVNYERQMSHNFSCKENDWGYSHFLTSQQIMDPENGWYANDFILLEVSIKADTPEGPKAQPQMTIGECSVCHETKINCALVPCGHTCMCAKCATTEKDQKHACPMCRTNIDNVFVLQLP